MAAAARLSLLRNKAWLGGNWIAASNGATFPVYNPSSGQKIADVPDMTERDAETAIKEAYKAQKKWGTTIAKERSKILRALYEVVMENQEELATIISLETGKPITDSRAEVAYGASYSEWYSEEAKRIYGDLAPPIMKGRRVIYSKQPVGVAAMITPWNFPFAMIMRKASAALAAGCACIVKPSEETPLTALAMAELTQQAQVPPGVFNVLSCSRETTPSLVDILCYSELVRKLSFTGSTGVGKLLMEKCARTVKRVSMELGGNAPLIVFNSANIETAVRGTLAAKFRNTGQACISSNRILVQSGIYDEFVSALNEAMAKQLKLGDAFQEGVNQGPLINMAAINKVEGYVSDAVSKGAEVIMGGARDETLGELFYKPSLLVNTTTEMRLTREEIFGPVVPVMKFEGEEEAVSIANDTPFGLASYIFSTDLSQTWRVGEAMESGIVGINEGAISSETAPFGGIKQSGFGREGSKYGIEDYLQLKYMLFGDIKE